MKVLCCFIFFASLCALSSFAKAQIKEKVLSPSDKKPLVLLWIVSHTRNTDQIGLIFRTKSVELITNTSSYQTGRIAQLGRFKASLTPELKDLKQKVGRYYNQLKKTVPLSSLIKDSRLQTTGVVDPHAPTLWINKEQVDYEHSYFKPLANIIYKIWDHKWSCMECAIYRQEKESVVRVLKIRSLQIKTEVKAKNSKAKKQWEIRRQRISKKLLDCVSKDKNKVECVDPQFGIFKI